MEIEFVRTASYRCRFPLCTGELCCVAFFFRGVFVMLCCTVV